MTGEITLRGKVLPIGGLKEKILAAIRAGIKTVIIPSQNEKDLVDIPKVILKKVQIIPVTEVAEVLKIALDGFSLLTAADAKPSPKGKRSASVKVTVPSRKGIDA